MQLRAVRLFASVVVACVIYYVGAIAALHILSPEIHPTRQFMSEYVVGPYGALMTTTFFVLCAGSLALSAALVKERHAVRTSRTGLAMLMVWTVMILIAGVFATDPDAGRRSTAGMIHGIASMLGFVSVIVALRDKGLVAGPYHRLQISATGWYLRQG